MSAKERSFLPGMNTSSRRRNRSSSPAEDSEEPRQNKRSRGTKEAVESEGSYNFQSCEEVVLHFAPPIDPLPITLQNLAKPTSNEIEELEDALGFQSSEERWREDWAGNLAYADEDIVNPIGKGKKKQSFRQSLILWAGNNDQCKRLLQILVRHVTNMDKTPEEAKRILGAADWASVSSIESAIRRTCYDPAVLRQDGWVTSKADKPTGSIGGPHLIGDMIRWQNSDAVVIAFVHDHDIGDLWKACWVEDMNTFDLEAEELVEARRKWERRNKGKVQITTSDPKKQPRANGSGDFRVDGINEGIVLASSQSQGARTGVFWPARVMHATESSGSAKQSKRSIAKSKISLMFLAPYWDSSGNATRRVEALSEQDNGAFGSADLFQFESVEANGETIKDYTFDPGDVIDLSKFEVAFRFTGLPKGAFQRFIDSHRIALSLKSYARKHLKKEISAAERASFGLFDSHPLSVMAPAFPPVVLHLPYSFILSQLPVYKREDVMLKPQSESVLDLSSIVESMKPPKCWNIDGADLVERSDPDAGTLRSPEQVVIGGRLSSLCANSVFEARDIGSLLASLPHLASFFEKNSGNPVVDSLLKQVAMQPSVDPDASSSDQHRSNEQDCDSILHLVSWASLKAYGEDVISSVLKEKRETTVSEWRRLAERIFRQLISQQGERFSTMVITDSRCNLHTTGGFNFERSVRLPAALKGAKLAASSSVGQIRMVQSVKENFARYVETSLLRKVHDSAYIKRIKRRCMASKAENELLMLTEDSDGAGGEDTRGCRGSWEAAVHCVAAVVSAVEKVAHGTCANAFCATRPPGHHAGRKLHAMKAVSNGFCLLNAVACAAVHAVSPVSEGGLGLRRVCVIDFDVHHGNGTQDILCSVHDPRFLYVSIHAGGIHQDGKSLENDDDSHGRNPKSTAGLIFPGACGDTSPHKGVVNIPLGAKVTSHAVGNALLTKVTPAVDRFCPDLIILSAGFDAHKNDPMNLGALSAEDFGHITDVACQLAFKSCSGRIVSVLEGGYGVPCCRPQKDVPSAMDSGSESIPFCQPLSAKETQTCNGNSVSSVVNDPICPTNKTSEETCVSNPSTKEGHDVNTTADSEVNVSPNDDSGGLDTNMGTNGESVPTAAPRPQPSKLADLGDLLPENIDDQVPLLLQRKLEKCHDEGFIDCVREHVIALARCGGQQASLHS